MPLDAAKPERAKVVVGAILARIDVCGDCDAVGKAVRVPEAEPRVGVSPVNSNTMVRKLAQVCGVHNMMQGNRKAGGLRWVLRLRL